MSFAAQTWTMDTANTPWVYSNGIATEMADTAQTVSFTATDTGDGGIYFGAPGCNISLLDGNKLVIEGNKDLVFFASEANGTTYRNGSLWASINGGPREEITITTMTVTNGDAVGANNITNITFEYPGKPYQWSWTNINTA